MTNSPTFIATIHSRDDLTKAVRERRKDLGMCQLEVDDRAGLPDGYTAKIEVSATKPRSRSARSIGWMSLPLLMEALGMDLVAVRRGSLRKRLTRAERAKRGAQARNDRLSPERRQEIARRAAAARWARKGC